MGWKKSARSKRTVTTLALAVVCAAGAAMVIVAKTQPVQPVAVDMQAETATTATPAMSDVVLAPATKAPAKKAAMPAKTAASAKASATAATTNPSLANAVTSEEPAAKTRAVEPEMKTPAQASSANAPAASAAVMTTIAGCLERDGGGFRLKDTDGAAAPKSRGWKSGFLKKGSSRIDLVDSANRLKFQDHVGQRVSVTGTLNDRELTARSLQRVATSCE